MIKCVPLGNSCVSQLKVQVKEPRPIYEPGESFKLQIIGDPGAKVGLVAVDKAVHGLNQNRLTQTKVKDVYQHLNSLRMAYKYCLCCFRSGTS